MKVTLSTKNRYQVKKLEELAKEWGVTLSKEVEKKMEDEQERQKKAWDAIRELRKMNAFSDIDDPIEWQRKQRKDRNIGWDE